MSNFERLIGVALFLSLLPAALKADPLASLPKGDTAYTILMMPRNSTKVSANEDQSGVSLAIRQIRVTRLGNLTRYQLTWTDGRTTEAWQAGKPSILLEQNIWNGDVYASRSDEPGALPTMARLSDDALSWITGNNFVDDVTHEGRSCAHYQREMNVSAPPDGGELPSTKKAIYQAWIDTQTKLPMALDDGETMYRFIYDNQAPTGMLTMPSAFKVRWERYQAAARAPRHL